MGRPVSEDAVLALLDEYFPRFHPSLLLGRGDDCAVLRSGGPLCLSTDLFLEDVHFRRAYFTPEEIGHKALAVNVSDLAACGAAPLAFTLGLAVPPDTETAYLEGIFRGMAALGGSLRMGLAGGDLSGAGKLCLSLTVWGACGPERPFDGGKPERLFFLSREGARPGDILFLVGGIGLARAGLALLEEMGGAARGEWPAACAAFLRPEPRVDAGRILARLGRKERPPALMDVSDGLARDLPRLLGAGKDRPGADLRLPEAALHAELARWARQRGKDPVREAYLGGEDYALLGSCLPSLIPALRAALPELREIGAVTPDGIVRLNGTPVDGEGGFDHFTRF